MFEKPNKIYLSQHLSGGREEDAKKKPLQKIEGLPFRRKCWPRSWWKGWRGPPAAVRKR